MSVFKGKVAIVTGGGSGLGEAISKELAAKGASVVVSDINLPGAQRVVDEIVAAGGVASAIEADTANPDDSAKVVKYAVDTYGALHLAVNNAGIGGEASLVGDYSPEGWRKVIGINLSGVFLSLRAELGVMAAAGAGSIVNISSILGFVGYPYSCAYVAAKHGVIGLTQNAALEYAAQGVRVNSVHPGFIDTPLVTSSGIERGDDTWNAIAAKHAMGRWGTTHEVAEVVLWLLSDKASFVTGSQYVVDGGYLAQ